MCKGRKDLTEETKFMLDILRATNTIEDALYIIFRRLEFVHKVFNELMNETSDYGHFAIIFLRNLESEGFGK